jgi:hypothetical protein
MKSRRATFYPGSTGFFDTLFLASASCCKIAARAGRWCGAETVCCRFGSQTVAMKLQMASCTPSPASGLLPVPARQCHIPKLIDRKTCRPTIRSALGRSPLAGDRRDGLRALRRPQAGSYRSRRGNVISADSPKLIDRKTCRPTIRSALGRSPLAGDRRDGLVHSVARKRAPTGPSAAMSSLPTAPSSSIERRADQPMRSALGRSPLAGDRRDGLVLSVARRPAARRAGDA